MNVQVAGLVKESCQNGDGLRNVIFFSGCDKNCPGCHNKEMQCKSYGDTLTTDTIVNELLDSKNTGLIDGITVSGGEPFLQPEALDDIITKVKDRSDYTVWVYSGRTLAELEKDARKNIHIKNVLKNIDVLVDGPFISELPSTERFKGSSNQVIHRKKKK